MCLYTNSKPPEVRKLLLIMVNGEPREMDEKQNENRKW